MHLEITINSPLQKELLNKKKKMNLEGMNRRKNQECTKELLKYADKFK